jgi:histone H1/5
VFISFRKQIMAITRAQAQKICTNPEMQLVLASLADGIGKLTAVQLRSKISRVRTLRDKNLDLFRRQSTSTKAATRTKRGNTGAANANTERKAQLFDETLKRFEARLAKLETAAAKTAAKPAKKAVARKSPTKAAVKKAPAKPAAPKKSVAKKAAAKKVAAKKVAAKKVVAKKPAAKKAAPKKVAVKKVAAKKPVAKKAVAKKPAAKKAVAKKAVAKAPVARAQRSATAVSKVVSVRTKVAGAHARTTKARSQAKKGR